MKKPLGGTPLVGIVGAGVVGRAVGSGFESVCDVIIYDKLFGDTACHDRIANEADYIFITVPTDQVEVAVEEIDKQANEACIIIIKSTVPLGTTRKLAKKYERHDFIMNPEFLTNRTARFGFLSLARIILGGTGHAPHSVAWLYRMRFPESPLIITSWEAAELAKYVTNCFFIVKIAYANEVYEMCREAGVNYQELKEMWLLDGRVAHSHADVPGPDGFFGFGGKCFPENLDDLLEWGEEVGLSMDMLNAAKKVNQRVRKNNKH